MPALLPSLPLFRLFSSFTHSFPFSFSSYNHPITAGKAGGGGRAKDMSKKDFLEMLKSSTSKTGASSSSSSKKGEQKKGKNPFFDETPGGQGEGGREETEASWAAIQDDYLMTAPKINDYSEEEEEEGEMEGEGMMSESDEE